VADQCGDYDKHLMRLAEFLVRDHATAEQVVRNVLASSPPQVRDAGAERRAVVNRCRAILRERYRRPDG
jgi:hypothetical protein